MPQRRHWAKPGIMRGLRRNENGIEQQLADGRLREAFDGAQQLLQRAARQARGLSRCWLRSGDGLYPAGPVFRGARGAPSSPCRFWTRRGNGSKPSSRTGPAAAAAGMASACLTERGDCLRDLGRLDEAAIAYEENIQRAEKLGDERQVAVGKGQLGAVRMNQRRYPEALKAYEEARERFTRLDEPGTVAVIWHQTGMVHEDAGQPDAAEDAYRKSLAIKVRLGDIAGQASTLNQLGNLYDDVFNRPEEAVAFFRQAADSIERPCPRRRHEEQPRRHAAQARSLRQSAAGNHAGDRMQRGVRPCVHAVEDVGRSSPKSRRPPATPPPPRRRSARQSPAILPIAATAARITTAMAGSPSP